MPYKKSAKKRKQKAPSKKKNKRAAKPKLSAPTSSASPKRLSIYNSSPVITTQPHAMRSLSPVLASLANVFKIPISQTTTRPSVTRACNEALLKSTTNGPITSAVQASATRSFTTTNVLLKRKGNAPRGDRRVTLIRYFLWHPLTPRPLRFSRTRFLRHWTIHRAWNLFQSQQRRAQQLELQRQWQAMSAACEELRTGAGDGGKLFRKSMNKRGVFRDLFPIEYGRLQTEGPSEEGWNHEWKRMEKK